MSLFLFGSHASQAELWVGMGHEAAIAELGSPESTLKTGDNEIHFYEGSRKVVTSQGRVQSISGFPESMVKEVKARASKTLLEQDNRSHSPFIDFSSVSVESEKPYTLQGGQYQNAIATFFEKADTPTLYLAGGGALALIGLLLLTIFKLLSRDRRSEPEQKRDQINSQLPPFLSASRMKECPPPHPPEKIGLLKDVYSKRSSLSIREHPIQDESSDLPRKKLVKNSSKKSGNRTTTSTENTANSNSAMKLKLKHD